MRWLYSYGATGSPYKTSRMATMTFKLPEFSKSKDILPGRYGKMYTFSVSQIYNSNIYLIQLHLDNDYILILEKSKFKSISTFQVI